MLNLLSGCKYKIYNVTNPLLIFTFLKTFYLCVVSVYCVVFVCGVTVCGISVCGVCVWCLCTVWCLCAVLVCGV